MTKQTLELMEYSFSIHSFSPETKVPESVFDAEVYFIGKTIDELSIVVPEEFKLDSLEVEDDWNALEVLGPLGFSMTGILANISGVLAANQISIFAISTFDTDYILIKKENISLAIDALRHDGYKVIGD